MSALLMLQDIDDRQELEEFSFYHQLHHQQIVQALQTKFGTQFKLYVLDPFNIDDEETWLFYHQQAHTDMNNALNYNGVDLQDVDFASKVQKRIWVRQNFDEHLNAEIQLAITP